jgi:tetratricopeptide (TPR) repeat protein
MSRGRIMAVCAALVALTLLTYSGVLSNGFVNYDDGVYVAANPHVQNGLRGDAPAWAFTATANSNWHPVTWLSHMLDVQLFGLDASKHHATSLLLHAANVLLLFLLLVRMTGALWRPAFAAALFAVHPLGVESVAWIAERKNVLSTLFWLLTTLAWLRWLERKTVSRYALVVSLFALGLMAKPMLVTLPFTLMLFDYWPLKRTSGRPLVGEKIPLFAMAAVSSVVTVAVQHGGGALKTLERFSLSQRVANAVLAYVGYLGKTVWPASLAVFYPYPRIGLMSIGVAAAAVLLAAVTGFAISRASKRPYLAVSWLWYLGTLVPVIGIVQAGEQSMADRYTYVPLIGIFVALSWGLGELKSLSRPAAIAIKAGAACSIAVLLILTRAQAATWSGSESLFRHALAVTADNWTAHNNLGGLYVEQGRTAEAVAEFEETIRIRPGFAEGHYNLALALGKTGRSPESIEHYDEALRLKPDYQEARYNFGNALMRAGRLTEAIDEYEKALALKADDANAHNNLAIALGRTGRRPEAIEHYREALRLNPNLDAARENLKNAEAFAAAHP